eukprot:gnl/TRDRNA2_/TRDRNA2_144614_c0_seq1.p4 gnl/TRDRNA2_/TRDRNA2_144614_c0~~gnl/TRDRNA2_/TRDRNA2_144614_c0_seq1.p4  ORF type:complete len:116 (+),score=12.20 gnl/TRDRNA2_/TRDRNA2_144614_c0_seq1:153-500(+)
MRARELSGPGSLQSTHQKLLAFVRDKSQPFAVCSASLITAASAAAAPPSAKLLAACSLHSSCRGAAGTARHRRRPVDAQFHTGSAHICGCCGRRSPPVPVGDDVVTGYMIAMHIY